MYGHRRDLPPFYIERIGGLPANPPLTNGTPDKFQAKLRSNGLIAGPERDTYTEAEADGPGLVAKIVADPVATH